MIILIADDDRLVRFTIKSMLMEILEFEHHLYLEAANGKEMQRICTESRPEIVFTDIRMPYLTGLEAIEKCREELPDTEFVIVSGYSEFEYAKKAICLGVYEYLLKPIEEKRLWEVTKTLQKKLNQKKRESNSVFHMKMLNAFHYYSTAGMEEKVEEFCRPEGYGYLGFELVMRSHLERRTEAMEQQKCFLNKVRRFGEEIIARKGYYSMVYSPEGMPCFIFCCTWEEQSSVVSALNRICASAAKGPAFVCVFRFQGDTIEEIFKTCEQIDRSAFTAMNYPNGSVISWADQKFTVEEREVLRMTEKLMEQWESAEEIGYKETLNTMYRLYRETRLGLNLRHLSACCRLITERNISQENYKEFCRSLVELGTKMYGNLSAEETDIVKQIKEDIRKNYMKDISISQFAEKYGLTANYLSTLFHHKAGCRFVEYLAEVRITNAKKFLLKNTSASVKDIALMVGYNSARHFSALFQKQTGMTPSAYRKKAEEQ